MAGMTYDYTGTLAKYDIELYICESTLTLHVANPREQRILLDGIGSFFTDNGITQSTLCDAYPKHYRHISISREKL